MGIYCLLLFMEEFSILSSQEVITVRLNELCYICDIRKRKIVRLLFGTENGLGLGQKIIHAMQHCTNPLLVSEDLELLKDIIGNSFTEKMFAEEIRKERKRKGAY